MGLAVSLQPMKPIWRRHVSLAECTEWASVERDELDLVKRCLAGDQAACTRLVEAYVRMVGTVIWRATGNSNVVEDLVQETFLRVFRALAYFDARAKLSTWICTIAHRVAIDHLRKVGRWVEQPLAEETNDQITNPERAVAQREIDELVREGLKRLPDKYRIALVYAAIEELDYATIAAMLDVPVGTVKTLIFRGKRMLKEMIGDGFDAL
jgi:RNA polymerase sigma-70 factor, ECF subfamily